jgi:glycyl-tRNA synthetase
MAEDKTSNEFMDKLVALCKRRGFIFQSSEIYGGINGFWDYGPLGVELKRNIKEAWWRDNVTMRDDMVGVDCSIIMNPKVWEASGHVAGFNDPMVTCKECKKHLRADKVFLFAVYDPAAFGQADGRTPTTPILLGSVEGESEVDIGQNVERVVQKEAKSKNIADLKAAIAIPRTPEFSGKANLCIEGKRLVYPVLVLPLVSIPKSAETGSPTWTLICPLCGGELTEARKFNMMFESWTGAMQDSSSKVYLRPETAQGIFANYKNVLDTTRIKPPFGIAQVGKSFRNEINPRNYTFRSREFEQMEIEFFCHPSEADKWYEYWRDRRYNWYIGLGLTSSKLRLRPHEKDELAFYARACADVEYQFPFGISELEGIANRTDYDLTQHQKFSGKDMTFFNDETKEKYIPFVIEPSGGVDRATLAFLCEAYTEDQAPDENGAMQTRVVMKFHPRLAPTKVAVFPLVKKEGMPEIAAKIHQACKTAGLTSFYDEKGAVGRRYRRQDEAGTPFCVTVDGQTLTDQTVTVRDRDSLKQERIGVDKVAQYVKEKLG